MLARDFFRLGRLCLFACALGSGCAAEHVIGSLGFVVDIYESGAKGARAVAFGDFDGDGHGDVAVIAGDARQLCWLAGQSDGTLAAPRCQTLNDVFGVQFAVAGRFLAPPPITGSSPWDLLTAGSDLQTFAWQDDGTFRLTSTYSLNDTGGAAALALGDVDGDGVIDPLIADFGSATVSLWPTRLYRKLGPPQRYVFAEPQRAIAFADLDGDGRGELFGVSRGGLAVDGVHGPAAIAQCPLIELSPFGDPTAVAAIDGAGDGALDLVVADSARGGLVRLRRSGPLTFDCDGGALLQATNPVAALLRADFDGDGRFDLLALNGNDDVGAALLIFAGSAYSAAPPPRYPLPAGVVAGALGDVDGDGRTDVAVLLKDGRLALLRNTFVQ